MRPDPQGPFKRDPPAPYRMRDRLTHTQDVIVLCHLGIPRIERDQWSLTVHGMVERPLTLRFDDLVRYPKTEVASVHQCCDNPLAPFVPTRRVSNVIWGGVRLTDVLADCRPSPAAQYIWSYGADFGEFNGVAVEAYVKDLPITRIAADVLIGYELDGARHETRETTPVWSIAPESLIVSPAPLRRSSCRPSRKSGAGPGQMTGFATSTSAPTTRQHGGRTELEPRRGREWQRFSMRWVPERSGAVVLASLAEATDGLLQPFSGRRNAIHEVPVNVT